MEKRPGRQSTMAGIVSAPSAVSVLVLLQQRADAARRMKNTCSLPSCAHSSSLMVVSARSLTREDGAVPVSSMGYTEQAAQVKAKYRARAPAPPPAAPSQPLYHETPAHLGAREEEQVVYTASETAHCDLEEEEALLLVGVMDDEDGLSMEDDSSHMSHSPAHELPEPVSLVGRALRTHWPAERGRWEVRCVVHAHHHSVLPNVPPLHSCAAEKISYDHLPRTLLFDMSL